MSVEAIRQEMCDYANGLITSVGGYDCLQPFFDWFDRAVEEQQMTIKDLNTTLLSVTMPPDAAAVATQRLRAEQAEAELEMAVQALEALSEKTQRDFKMQEAGLIYERKRAEQAEARVQQLETQVALHRQPKVKTKLIQELEQAEAELAVMERMLRLSLIDMVETQYPQLAHSTDEEDMVEIQAIIDHELADLRARAEEEK